VFQREQEQGLVETFLRCFEVYTDYRVPGFLSSRPKTHSLARERVGGHNSDDKTDTLVLYRYTIIPLRARGTEYCGEPTVVAGGMEDSRVGMSGAGVKTCANANGQGVNSPPGGPRHCLSTA
jgi:hypothetical protein